MTQFVPDGALSNAPIPVAFLSRAWPWLLVATLGAAIFYWDGLVSLGAAWSRPEYSYGPMVPFITAYLALQEIHRRPVAPDHGSRFWGYVVFAIAILVGLVGNFAQIPDVITYGFILFVGALVLVLAGTREGLRFWPGWLHLIFMLPLPQFIYLSVSTKLQVLSSAIGVWFIQLANVPVFLDGNIIDLGVYKLQVAEACSGLAYLFPLFSFGWLMAALYRGPNWHRVVIFLSTVPVTILMNSFRIGVIGVLVNSYGISQAEGFLHFFEGWVIFIACTLILYVEAWILWRFVMIGAERSPRMLAIDFQPGLLRPVIKFGTARTTFAFGAVSMLVLAAGLAWQLQPAREDVAISRLPLGLFPIQIGDWEGTTMSLEPDIERVLAADDYLVANYQDGASEIGLLLTFYKSQTQGSGIHSPEVCLPSGGWEVSRWEQVTIPTTQSADASIRVNRAIIQRGLERQLVYYWFEGRGRQTPSDYEAKFLSMWDTVTTGRSDGGLVRVITPMGRTESIEDAAERLNGFLRQLMPLLPEHYPTTTS